MVNSHYNSLASFWLVGFELFGLFLKIVRFELFGLFLIGSVWVVWFVFDWLGLSCLVCFWFIGFKLFGLFFISYVWVVWVVSVVFLLVFGLSFFLGGGVLVCFLLHVQWRMGGNFTIGYWMNLPWEWLYFTLKIYNWFALCFWSPPRVSVSYILLVCAPAFVIRWLLINNE